MRRRRRIRRRRRSRRRRGCVCLVFILVMSYYFSNIKLKLPKFHEFSLYIQQIPTDLLYDHRSIAIHQALSSKIHEQGKQNESQKGFKFHFELFAVSREKVYSRREASHKVLSQLSTLYQKTDCNISYSSLKTMFVLCIECLSL
jgi:hypothetical protein